MFPNHASIPVSPNLHSSVSFSYIFTLTAYIRQKHRCRHIFHTFAANIAALRLPVTVAAADRLGAYTALAHSLCLDLRRGQPAIFDHIKAAQSRAAFFNCLAKALRVKALQSKCAALAARRRAYGTVTCKITSSSSACTSLCLPASLPFGADASLQAHP